MNKYTLAGLSIIGGILTGIAWTDYSSGLILLVSLSPFIFIEEYLYKRRNQFTPNAFFIFLLPGMVLFSMITMGWMRTATLTGAIFVILGLSFIMASVATLAHSVRIRKGNIAGITALAAFWLTYEFISLNIILVSPWINLGNGLAKDLRFIQWYDITGSPGGTLWILFSNILFASVFISGQKKGKRQIIIAGIWLLAIIIPSMLSFYKFKNIKEAVARKSEVVIVQPDIDPFTVKFSTPFDSQLSDVIALAQQNLTDSTSWLITPETTIDDPVNLDSLGTNKYVTRLRELTMKNRSLNIITGMVTFRNYPYSDDPPTVSARETGVKGYYRDFFNSACQISDSNKVYVYHKSKLVPGIEMQFSNGPGRIIKKILPELGGTNWGYGIQDERNNFIHSVAKMSVAPVICYESVFGKFNSEYIKKGASAIFIITNDGWWKNTGGYKQHLNFASLRAIENRRPVVRVGNTGISCFIDIRGQRTSETRWWEKTTLRGSVIPESHLTFYTRHPDIILIPAVILAVLIIFYVFVAGSIKKKFFINKICNPLNILLSLIM